ncbi:MAG: DUF4430 domain-containing protein [Candidatus Taylorbacteria bacterium]|nr:DUF4430 domain-containing protein [Candidatus Taylorbacteria bacterium]
MKNNSRIALSIAFALILFSTGAVFSRRPLVAEAPEAPSSSIQAREVVAPSPREEAPLLKKAGTRTAEDVAHGEAMSVSVSIGGEAREALVPIGATAYDAMALLRKQGKAEYESTYYPSLGHFIKEIAGKENEGGYYWTLYINGEYSERGASSAVLTDGDKVEWRYENK